MKLSATRFLLPLACLAAPLMAGGTTPIAWLAGISLSGFAAGREFRRELLRSGSKPTATT